MTIENDPVKAPVACSLGVSAGAEQSARWAALSLEGQPHSERQPGELIVRYRLTRRGRRELEELVAVERQCCGFAAWEVFEDGDDVVLRVSGEPAGVSAIAQLFRAR